MEGKGGSERRLKELWVVSSCEAGVATRYSMSKQPLPPLFSPSTSQPSHILILQVEREAHGDAAAGSGAEVRRYAVVALTNLTFGNTAIKSFLCSFDGFVPVMVKQLESPVEPLLKATAHLFR